ncbi:hypothetical protein S245_052244, partial [Arachis hypogaea]
IDGSADMKHICGIIVAKKKGKLGKEDKEDVAIMKYMNTDAYRFSISWFRVLP